MKISEILADVATFNRLYGIFFAHSLFYLYGCREGPEEAKIVVSETFRAMLELQETYDHTRPLEPWARMVCHNLTINAVKKLSNGPKPLSEFYDQASQEDLIEEAYLKNENLNEASLKINAALLQLPKDQRQCIVLRYYGWLSFLEIAERMGKTPAAVRGLHMRALDNMRKILKENSIGFQELNLEGAR